MPGPPSRELGGSAGWDDLITLTRAVVDPDKIVEQYVSMRWLRVGDLLQHAPRDRLWAYVWAEVTHTSWDESRYQMAFKLVYYLPVRGAKPFMVGPHVMEVPTMRCTERVTSIGSLHWKVRAPASTFPRP